MIKLEASFKIVTPLFMSGADKERAELRAASIRGVLRFWWRALALGHYGTWQEVRKAEFNLFGSSSGGQSRVHLSLKVLRQSDEKCKPGGHLKDGLNNYLWPGLRYLGYGAIQPELRPHLDSPVHGALKLYLRPSAKKIDPEMEADLLEEAIMAMGLLGGLGSRSRRGFGSFNLLELKRDGMTRYPKNKEDYLDSLSQIYEKHAIELSDVPDYTAFSQDSRAYILKKGKDPLELLDEIGEEMQMYRSWGQDKGGGYMVGDKPAEQNFKDDHDNMRNAFFAPAIEHPRRVAFGLPHNYHFTKLNRNLTVLPEKHERRSSPLFLHIHELSNCDYVAVASIFPTKFLPPDECILIQPKDGKEQTLPIKHDWFKELIIFVEGAHKITGLKRFPDLKTIWPKPKVVSK